MSPRTSLIALILLLAMSPTLAATEVDVQIEGLTGNLLANVMEALSMHRYRELPELTDTMVHRLHARAPREIREALMPFGFYEAEVDASLDVGTGRWVARYVVRTGEPVRIREFDLRVDGPGKEHAAFTAISNLPLPGDRLRHPDYERIKQALQDTANDLGYLDARFTTNELRVSVSERAADIILHLETGERYRFGTITLEQDILDEAFVQRFVPFETGDPFSLASLLQLQYALGDSEYFNLVEVDASHRLAGDLNVPVTVSMHPARRHRYTAGIGFATDTGPRGLAGWQNRRVNRRGHRLSADVKLSRVYQSLTTRYLIPLENPVWERLTLVGNLVREELGDIDSERAELVGAWVTRQDRWQQTLSTTVLRERDILNANATLRTQIIPGGEWIYTGGESGPRPRDATRFTLNVSGSGPTLGAPTLFLSVRARTRLTFPIGEQDRLLLRLDVGAIATDDATSLSASQRFFAGGDYSVRGYRFNSLGPRNVDGDVIGGKYLAAASVEWEHWLTDQWGVAVFADHGNAFNDFGDGFSTGAGIGLRWQLPFAVFALDVAHPFDDPGGRRARIHLTLGIDL